MIVRYTEVCENFNWNLKASCGKFWAFQKQTFPHTQRILISLFIVVAHIFENPYSKHYSARWFSHTRQSVCSAIDNEEQEGANVWLLFENTTILVLRNLHTASMWWNVSLIRFFYIVLCTVRDVMPRTIFMKIDDVMRRFQQCQNTQHSPSNWFSTFNKVLHGFRVFGGTDWQKSRKAFGENGY